MKLGEGLRASDANRDSGPADFVTERNPFEAICLGLKARITGRKVAGPEARSCYSAPSGAPVTRVTPGAPQASAVRGDGVGCRELTAWSFLMATAQGSPPSPACVRSGRSMLVTSNAQEEAQDCEALLSFGKGARAFYFSRA